MSKILYLQIKNNPDIYIPIQDVENKEDPKLKKVISHILGVIKLLEIEPREFEIKEAREMENILLFFQFHFSGLMLFIEKKKKDFSYLGNPT
jgi:hypothetical protein